MTSGLPTFRSYLQSLGQLVVQPRMGFSRPDEMRAGMIATATCGPRTVATITIDSYSRVNDRGRAAEAVRQDLPLNGYPIIVHPAEVTRELVGAVGALGVPVQVRHGSALALPIVESLVMAGITATEGGPVSYTLPYSRVRLNAAVEDWRRSCSCLAESSPDAHLESFGGCMLGQLCPPSMLVAISVLESLFFVQQGLRSVSLSYAQQTNRDQDLEALHALRRFASELLPDTDWHIVLYAYMGVYPKSYQGGFDLLADASQLAVMGGASRLIVKTPAEAHRIPSVEENLASLRYSDAVAARAVPTLVSMDDSPTYSSHLTRCRCVWCFLGCYPRFCCGGGMSCCIIFTGALE